MSHQKKGQKTTLALKTTLTAHSGINSIGGGVFEISSNGNSILVDCGLNLNTFNSYFMEFMQPRKGNALLDLSEFNMLTIPQSLIRKDHAQHMNVVSKTRPVNCLGAFITHSHLDHFGQIPYLDPSIPLYWSEPTDLNLNHLEEVKTSSDTQYVTYKDDFQVKKKNVLEKSRARTDAKSRTINIVGKKEKFDDFKIRFFPVDHSIPGTFAMIIDTPGASIGFSSDFRLHGRTSANTEKFFEQCSKADLDYLLIEGTRIDETHTKTELDVESDVTKIIKNLVVCNYPYRDFDRFLSIYNAAVASGRDLVIDMKQAHLLEMFENSNSCNNMYPKLDDRHLKIFVPKRSWCLIDKDVGFFTKKLVLEDYYIWMRDAFCPLF